MSIKSKILLVDDDDDLRGALIDQLSYYDEFEAIEADNAKLGIEKATCESPALIILDLDMPDMSGLEACRLMRQREVKVPIIILTASDVSSDEILGFECGANDYVTKPFKITVLLARIRAHLRQYELSDSATLAIGPYQFKPAQKILLLEEEKLRLTEKEVGILRYLYGADHKMVSRNELLEKVWGYNSGVSSHTLETHIYRLRQKIESDRIGQKIIITESGGYKLAVPWTL